MNSRRVILSFVISFCALLCGAQLRFKSLPHNNRLSSNMINSIYQDDTGFVYIGTATGLNKYDGYAVEVFRNIKEGSLTLLDNNIKEIQKAPDGMLWVETGNDYAIFNPRQGRFENSVSDIMERIGVDGIPGMVAVMGDRYWFYVRGVGLWTYIHGEQQARRVDDPDNMLLDEALTDIEMVNNSQCMAVNLIGDLIMIDVDSNKVVRKLANPYNTAHVNASFRLCVDNERNIWVYSEQGTWIYDINGGGWKNEYHNQPIAFPMVKAIIQDKSGNIWLGLDHDGIIVISPEGVIQKMSSNDDDDQTLSSNSITSLYQDRAGTVWIGNRKSGVDIYNDQIYKFGFKKFPDVNCIIRLDDDRVLLGTDNEGLVVWDRSDDTTIAYRDEFTTPNNIYAIVCMEPSYDGEVWIGTYNGGLFKWSPDHITHYNVENGLSSNHIWHIVENEDHTLMLATLGAGIQIFDPATGKSERYNAANSAIGSDYVTSFAPAGDGKIYVATSWGLSTFDPVTKTIVNQTGNRKGDQNFRSHNINQAVVDSRGLVWLATYAGLDVYDPVADNVYQLNCNQKDSQEFIGGVVEDSHGQMWAIAGNKLVNVEVATNAGSSAYTFRTRLFDRDYGLQVSDFNQRSFCSLPDGELLVGGLRGVNYFNPADLTVSDATPKVFFTHLTVNNQPVVPVQQYEGDGAVHASLHLDGELRFPASVNDFTIAFATEDFYNADKVSYIYRLAGYNDEWIELAAESRPQVTYTNLPPGDYRLEVKAIGSNGVIPEKAEVLKIHVAPPFYLSVWAYILYFLLAVGIIWLIARLVRRRERKKFDMRKREALAKKQEELNQLKFKFFTNISHELRTPLTLISAPVESLLKKAADETSRRQLSIIQLNSMRLLNLVNQLLDFRKNEMSGLTLQASSGEVVSFIRSICDSFLMFSEKKGIQFSIEASPEHIQMDFDDDKMGKIVMNLLSNAFKYTPDGGRVSIRVTEENETLCLKVGDTGIGINDEDKKHIFDRFYQASESLNSHITGTGIGLSLVWEYAHLHGGTVAVDDNPGGGTVFTVTIPIRHEAAGARAKLKSDVPHENGSTPVIDNGFPVEQLVKDNSDMLDFISSELARDFNVLTARDGIEALDMVKRTLPDVIISDIMMPEMDGIELCRRLKADAATASVPLLLLTAKHDVAAKIEGLTLGADDYMTKPFNMDVLRLRLKKMLTLRKKGMQRALIELEPTPIAITSLDEQLVEKAVKYVEKNMDNPDLTVEEMAQEMGMSRVHLYKRLKELTGKTPIEFIRVLRLKRAAQMLRESQLNVSEIAYRCGFNSPKYFARYFKDEFGITPSAYQDTQDITKDTPKHNI